MDMYGALFAKAMGGGGSNVVPNPEGEATETLNKIGIDETIYGIPKELPEVTSDDEGDILAVNSSGAWAKAASSNKFVFINVTISSNQTTDINYNTIANILENGKIPFLIVDTGGDGKYLTFMHLTEFNPARADFGSVAENNSGLFIYSIRCTSGTTYGTYYAKTIT